MMISRYFMLYDVHLFLFTDVANVKAFIEFQNLPIGLVSDFPISRTLFKD